MKSAVVNTLYHGLFCLSVAIAALLYKQRLFYDGGADILCVINSGSFCFFHDRHILLFSQVLPLLLVKLGLPLKYVLIAFSISPVLFLYGLYALAHGWLKRGGSGILFLLLSVVTMRHTYFQFPISEVLYGSGLVLFAVQLLDSGYYKKITGMIAGAVCLYFILLSHPLVWPVFLLAMVLLAFRDSLRRTALYTAVFFGASAALLADASGSASGQSLFAWSAMAGHMPAHWDVSGLFRQWMQLLGQYPGLTVLMGASLVLLTIARQVVKAGFLAMAYLLAFLVIRDGPGVYVLVLTASAVLGLQSALRAIPCLQYSPAAVLLFVACFAGGLAAILQESRVYALGVSQVERFVDYGRQLEGDKFIVSEVHTERAGVPFLQYASTLLSSIDGGPTVIICTDDNLTGGYDNPEITDSIQPEMIVNLADSLLQKRALPACQANRAVDHLLHPGYFTISDEGFRTLEDDSLNAMPYLKNHLALELRDVTYLSFKRQMLAEVELVNEGETTVFSSEENGLYLLLYDVGTGAYSTDTQLLAVDLVDTFVQAVIQDFPDFSQPELVAVHAFRDSVFIASSDTFRYAR